MAKSSGTDSPYAEVVSLGERAGEPAAGPLVGWLVGWSSEEGPWVDFPGNASGPVLARATVAIDASAAADAIRSRRGVVLLFERNQHDLPLIVGLLVEPEPPPVSGAETVVDGERVELRADKEIELRCGQASIILRKNGRVVIRGTHVETRSKGVNRIKGGSVQIN